MRLLDRYVLRNFLEPFFICFFGFVAIWLVFDLQSNFADFLEAHVSMKSIARFYLSQLPFIAVLSMPIGILLALLFSLSRMSRHNEIISMVTAGCSIPRIILPLMVVGLVGTIVSYELNRELGPHAEAMKKRLLEQMSHSKKGNEHLDLESVLFRDRVNNRTWYVRRMQIDSPKLDGVHITQQDAAGKITTKWQAQRAEFVARNNSWMLMRGKRIDYDESGQEVDSDTFLNEMRVVTDWSETPWRIASSQMEAQNMSISELRDYLKYNSDFPKLQLAPFRTNLADRMALPWSCFIVIFIASPLGIVFSRRGVLAGVATSIFIFFGLILFRSLFLALGKGGRIEPFTAAWLPNVIFFVVGLFLLYIRTTGRELPKFRLKFRKAV